MWYRYKQFLVEIIIGPNCNNFLAFEFATYVVALILEHPRHMFDGGCVSVHINASDPKWHNTAPHVFYPPLSFSSFWPKMSISIIMMMVMRMMSKRVWERKGETRLVPTRTLPFLSRNILHQCKSELLHCLASIVKWNASRWSEYTWALSLAPIKGNIAQPCLSEVTALLCIVKPPVYCEMQVLQCKYRADRTIARLNSTDGCLSTTHFSWAQNVGGKEMVEK